MLETSASDTLVNKALIIFGAGQAGQAAKSRLSESSDIVAFCDSNASQLPSHIDGLPVIAPDELSTVSFDYVCIASEFFEQIKRQLTDTYSLAEDKILVLPASSIKKLRFGESEQARLAGLKLLSIIGQHLEAAGIKYYVDAGTLLGIYRDGEFIAWDDDLDVAICSLQVQECIEAISAALPELEQATGVKWMLDEHTCTNPFGAVNQGAIRSLKLAPTGNFNALPMMDFFVKYVAEDVMDYVLASRGIRMPSKFINDTQVMQFKGIEVRVPAQTEEYLSLHYGDWKTPKKDWDLSQLQNATVF